MCLCYYRHQNVVLNVLIFIIFAMKNLRFSIVVVDIS